MKRVYWLILVQYLITNINTQIVKNDKSEPTSTTTTAAPSTASPETSTEFPKQFHPNFMSPYGALDFGPFGTHPMSGLSGQSNMMFQLPQMFNPADPDMFPMVPPPVAAEMMSQLPPSSQMYSGQPSDPKMYQGEPPPGQQMYHGPPSDPQMYHGQPPSPQMYEGPPLGPHMYQEPPSNQQMYPGQPHDMMQMIPDHPAILPVLAPDQNPMVQGTLLPNPSVSPPEYPILTNPASPIRPKTEWAPLTEPGDMPEPTPIPEPFSSFNLNFPENFFPDMYPFSNPPFVKYPNLVTPTPQDSKQQQYNHPWGMSFMPHPNPHHSYNSVGKDTTAQRSPVSQGSAVVTKEPRSKPKNEPLPAETTVESPQKLPPQETHPQHPVDTSVRQQFHPNGAPFLPEPFLRQPYRGQGSELGAIGPKSRFEAGMFHGPFHEQPLPSEGGSSFPLPFLHHPFQSKGGSLDTRQFQKPQGEPNQGSSPFNFMSPFPNNPFFLPIPHAGEQPEFQPGGNVPIDPVAELGDYPGIMEYMNNENPFDLPPPPPFINRHTVQFPVLPPFLEGLPAPSENGQRTPGKKWSYKNSGHLKWPSKYSYCSGNRQSPVDIDDRNIIYTPNLKQFSFSGFNGFNSAFTVKNNGHTASIRISGNMSVSGGGFGDVYNTAEIHFHWGSNDRDGSEHAINGRKYPLEMHIVNYATKYGDLKNAMQYRDGLGVLGVLFDIGLENPAFSNIERQLKKVQNPGASAPLPTINVRQLLPDNAENYFRYYGSLTTPPCYQSVLWTIFEKKQTISPNQLESLRSLYETTKNVQESPNTVAWGQALIDNFRPLQPMFGRIINTNIKRYANPIYLAHPGMVSAPTVLQEAVPVIPVSSQTQESIPQFHPNKTPASAATAVIKQGVNQLASFPLPPQSAALNIIEPLATTIPTISSFRSTSGSVITVVDVPGNVSKPTELIVVNTSSLVEQLSKPTVRPPPEILTSQKTTHLKQLHPVITSTAAKTTPPIPTATSVIPTLLPITTSIKTPTTINSRTTTLLTTSTILPPTSPTLPPSTSTISSGTSTSSSTAQPINSQLKAEIQNFPSQSLPDLLAGQSNSIPTQSGTSQVINQLSLEPVPAQPIEPIIPTGTQQSSANAVQAELVNNLSLDPATQLLSAATQVPMIQVANPVDLSTQIVSDPLLQPMASQSSIQEQLSQRIIQEARQAAIEAAQQQLAKGSQQSPEFTQSVIAAATKAAQEQVAQLMAQQNFAMAPVEPLTVNVGHIDPSQGSLPAQGVLKEGVQQQLVNQLHLEQQATTGGAQQAAVQQAEQQLLEQRAIQQAALAKQQLLEQQAALAEQQLLEQQAAVAQQSSLQLAPKQELQAAQILVDRPQLLDQQTINQAAQQQFAQQPSLEQQSMKQPAQQAAIQLQDRQQLPKLQAAQAAQRLVDPPQLLDQQAITQATQQKIQQLLLEKQAAIKATQQAIPQPATQQLAEQQQLLRQQTTQQDALQLLLQQQRAASPAAQTGVQTVNTATQQTVKQPPLPQTQQLTNQALRQILAQNLATQQAANQQQAALQAALQAAQKQAALQAANHAVHQAANQAAQQAAQQAANQAAQQAANQAALQAANQAAQQAANQAALQAANQAALSATNQATLQAANQAALQAANQATQQQITQQQTTQQQPTQAQLIQQVLAQLRTQANFDKLTNQQMIKVVSRRVTQLQNQQKAANQASQLPANPLLSQQQPQQTMKVSGTTTNRQGTSANTRNILIQPSAQGTPMVSVLRAAPRSVQTLQSNRAQNVHWKALQRARANTQAQPNSNSQALTAAKSVSVLVPRQKSVVPTVRFASTSQKLHPVNVLPNQVRFKEQHTVKQDTGLLTAVQSYPRPPASSAGSQSSLIQAYFRALSKSKPEVVPVLRRVRTQFGDKKLLNYLQKKFGRLRTV